MKVKFTLLGCLLCCVAVQSQTYEGTIGSHKIFMELDTDYSNNRAVAFYFYQNQLRNINLEGTSSDNSIVIFEKYSEEAEKKELFKLKADGTSLEGTWQSGDQTLPIKLSLTTIKLREFKLSKITFNRDSVVSYGNKELVWFTEKYSKKTHFRLGNGFTAMQRDLINPELDSIHITNSETGLDCSWADITTVVQLVSDDFLSIKEYSSIYCGGAHPSHHQGGYTFDLKTGKQLASIAELYPELNLYKTLKKKYNEADNNLQDECEYFDEGSEEYWEYASWYLSPTGLTIIPSYPHAMTPCEEEFELTFIELK